VGTGEIEWPPREPVTPPYPHLPLPKVERLAAAVEEAVAGAGSWETRLSSGLSAGLDFLAADPPFAQLLLVDSLAGAHPARPAHERSLMRLAEALGASQVDRAGVAAPDETTRLLAGGLVSHLSGRVLAGEAKRLPESHGLLLRYLVAASCRAPSRSVGRRLVESR
jgi:hypothetical protein